MIDNSGETKSEKLCPRLLSTPIIKYTMLHGEDRDVITLFLANNHFGEIQCFLLYLGLTRLKLCTFSRWGAPVAFVLRDINNLSYQIFQSY